jgi:hypothetical protein
MDFAAAGAYAMSGDKKKAGQSFASGVVGATTAGLGKGVEIGFKGGKIMNTVQPAYKAVGTASKVGVAAAKTVWTGAEVATAAVFNGNTYKSWGQSAVNKVKSWW